MPPHTMMLGPPQAFLSFMQLSLYRSPRATRDFLQQNNVNVMNWPALSPDLNPIEHLWDEIQRQLNEEQPSPTTAAELSVAFLSLCYEVISNVSIKQNRNMLML
jgi:transposase